ncbi:MAG: DMT family transporter [Alphaproteobacteria bacterium]|nr:DMT family transporter [Alphaproteobacteria bacterium]
MPPGVPLALLSAGLFGATVPLAKLLLGQADPWLLAGIFYLGAGCGLAVVAAIGRLGRADRPRREAAVAGRGWWWLAAAVFAGGIVGPVLLMVGLARTTASTSALLLNLEGVFTALIAWFAFRENVDRRIAAGMAAIVAGAIVLSWQDTPVLDTLVGPACVALACLAWALDNNLTRRVALSDPVQVAMLKGLVAGAINTAIALALGAAVPAGDVILAAATVGFLGYGVSLVLFVLALRHLGTARTGAYYAAAPFVGAALSIVVFGDSVGLGFGVAGALMALGVWLHVTEQHEHEHQHEPLAHSHRHAHDAHHRHRHGPGDPPGETHAHAHQHGALRHAHPHFPDAHHRHPH